MQSCKLSHFFASFLALHVSLSFLDPYPSVSLFHFPYSWCERTQLSTSMNNYIKTVLSQCLAGFSFCFLLLGSPTSNLPNRYFSKVHRPWGSFDIDSPFWVLSHKVCAPHCSFWVSIPGVRSWLSICRRRWCLRTFIVPHCHPGPMPVDGLFCSLTVNFPPGFVQPRQVLAFIVLRLNRIFVCSTRIFFHRSLRWFVLFDNVSRSGLSFYIVCIPCYFFIGQ